MWEIKCMVWPALTQWSWSQRNIKDKPCVVGDDFLFFQRHYQDFLFTCLFFSSISFSIIHWLTMTLTRMWFIWLPVPPIDTIMLVWLLWHQTDMHGAMEKWWYVVWKKKRNSIYSVLCESCSGEAIWWFENWHFKFNTQKMWHPVHWFSQHCIKKKIMQWHNCCCCDH